MKHLDTAIIALMYFVHDKLFDRLIVLSKRKLTTKLKDIRKRRKSDTEIDTNFIIRYETGNRWKVGLPSSSGIKEVYLVPTWK